MKIQRLIAMLTVLLQKEKVSAPKLAQMFEVSVRTIYRDVETLEIAGIPMVTMAGPEGGIGILPQYKLDKKLLTSQDMSTLLMGLNTISGSVQDTKLKQTMEKIKALIPQQHSKNIQMAANQLYIDSTPWAASPHIAQNVKQIQQALEHTRVLCFEYTGRDQQTQTRKVQPHQLVLKEGNWYLRGYCQQRQDFRVFKTSRMQNLHITHQLFEPKEFDTEMTDFKNWTHPKTIWIELLADASMYERALDFCKEENITRQPDGQLYIHMPFVEGELGYNFLLGLGPKCRCIGPQEVCRQLAARLDEMRSMYPKE